MGFVDRKMDEGQSQQCWTYAMVEERLVEAVRLWWRAPGGGKSPYATDAPWQLMRRINEAGDAFNFWDPRGFDMKSSDVPLRPLRLARAEIARRDEASMWIERYIESEEDRRLICIVLAPKAAGRAPSWQRVLRAMGLERGIGRLKMRYSRGVARIAHGLDSDGVHVVHASS